MGEEVSPSRRERSSLFSHVVVEGRLVGRQKPLWKRPGGQCHCKFGYGRPSNWDTMSP